MSKRRFWLNFAVSCALLAALKTWQNVRYLAYHERSRQAFSAFLGRAQLARAQLNALKGQTRTSVEATVNGGRALASLAADPSTAVYRDPTSTATFHLAFRNDALRDVKMRLGGFNADARPPKDFGDVEQARQAVARHTPLIWLALVVLLVVRHLASPSTTAARPLAAGGILMILVWLLDPNFVPGAGRHLDGDDIVPPWGVAFVVITWILYGSVASLLHPLRSLVGQPPVCHTCGYNLTANLSGICPECGSPVTPEHPQPPAI